MAVRWPSEGFAPQGGGGGEGRGWESEEQGDAGERPVRTVFLYPSTHKQPCYHLSCVRSELGSYGKPEMGSTPHTAPQAGAAASTGTTWFSSLCTHTHIHTHTLYPCEKKAPGTSGLLIRVAKLLQLRVTPAASRWRGGREGKCHSDIKSTSAICWVTLVLPPRSLLVCVMLSHHAILLFHFFPSY